MKNPLSVFTGAALATLTALAGLNMTNWSPLPDDQKVPEVEAAIPPEASQETVKVPGKPAETGEIKVPEAGTPAAETPADAKPELDTVRVESDGQAVVAGRAKPGAEIALKLGDQVIGKGITNADGSWVVVPDRPLPKGAHEITVEQKGANSAPVTSEQSIAVAIPETAGQQAMVALTKPGAATKVLQAGDSQQQPDASSATAEQPEQPADTAKAVEKPAEPAQTPSAGQKTAEAAQPATEQPEVKNTAEAVQNPETAEPAGQSAGEIVAKTEELPTAVKPSGQGAGEVVAKTEELPIAVKPPGALQPLPEPPKKAKAVALRLDAVDYDDKGNIIFSGRAAPGTAIRLYVDNGDVGDAIVDSAGNWSFSGSDIIAPGTHTLRADQIDTAGKVMARIELPFQREDAAAVAALNAPPAPATPETSPATPSQTTEVQPPPATTTPPQTAKVQPQSATTTPPQTAEVQPPPATATPPQTTVQPPAAGTPPQTAEVAKTEPDASAPAPEQPAIENKKQEVTTAAVQTAKTTEPDKPRSGKVVIQPGNNLWKLSRVIYGRGRSYTVIFKANKDQIRNPNRIYPGQIFAIPNAKPPESIDPKRKEPLTSAEGGAAQ
jgi:nucleoid-associated protein YgaU